MLVWCWGTLVRHLCALRACFWCPTFIFYSSRNERSLVRFASSFLSLKHPSVHRVLDISVFASFVWLFVVRALGLVERRRSNTSLLLCIIIWCPHCWCLKVESEVRWSKLVEHIVKMYSNHSRHTAQMVSGTARAQNSTDRQVSIFAQN